MSTSLETIPGVGPNMADHLRAVGIECVEDLVGQDPQDIYERDCIAQKQPVDRCALYVYRLAVAYAQGDIHDPEKLKWWNWKD